MIYYKDCDLETGIEKILMNFSKEETKDYLTIQKYQQLIVEFVDGSISHEDCKNKIDELEGDLEDKTNAIASMSAELSELSEVVSGMRKSPIKGAIEDIIARMELDIC